MGKGSFVWNEVVFNSFRVGYLKQIDFEFYKELESAVSKRMYRFLDKRFYHRQRLEFDLRTFACEHVGLSKNYHNGELKRVLSPAIAELETRGFLKRMTTEDRFQRKAKGEWAVVFVRETKPLAVTEDLPEIAKALVDRGLNRSSARTLVAEVEEEKIREKLALFDWLCSRNDQRIKRNPAGFLYRAIAEDFALPDDYRAAVAPTPSARRARIVPIRVAQSPEEPSPKASCDRAVIDQFWSSLSGEEKERIEAELVRAAPLFLREQYIEGREGGGLLFQTIRQGLIDTYARTQLSIERG
jgi:hypothetical protein